jgi:CHAD domain-containing protein
MRAAAKAVRRARAQLRAWAIGKSWAALEPGLRRIYAKARAAQRRTDDDPSLENLHEWRKRAKDLRYALEILEPLWPPVMKSFAEEAHALTDRLGEDHDLSQLADTVAADDGPREDRDGLLGLIGARRSELQADARRLGAQLFGEKPRPFVARLRRYWKTWMATTGDGTRKTPR